MNFRRGPTRPVSCYAFFKGWLLLSQPPGCLSVSTSFPLSTNFGTLAGALGSFPFDDEAYPPPSHSWIALRGIQSLVGFSNLVRPLVHPALYHRGCSSEAAPKGISRRTSYNGI